MTSTGLAERTPVDTTAIEHALIGGDLAKLTTGQRLSYYHQVCQSLGLNPLTKPFAYLALNGKLTLYALKDCTEQLRSKRSISLTIAAREAVEDCYIVTARASMPGGRVDESIGAVPLGTLRGEARANALMKAETKAKRRVTLSICGLGMLDELEVDAIPTARVVPVDVAAEEVAAPPEPLELTDPADAAIPAEARRITQVEEGTAGAKGRIFFHAPVDGQESLLTWKQWIVDLATELQRTREPAIVTTKRSGAGNVRVESLARLHEPDPDPAPPLDDIPF